MKKDSVFLWKVLVLKLGGLLKLIFKTSRYLATGVATNSLFSNFQLGEIAGVDKEKIQAGIVVEISSTDSNLLLDDLQGEFDACSELQNDENLPMILDGAA